jgi:hypothetical protein
MYSDRTLLPPVSNREDLYLPLSVFDDDTGQPIDMVALGWTFQFEIRRGGPKNTGSGYIPFYDWGTPDDLGPLISATLNAPVGAGTIIIDDVGFMHVMIPETLMRTLSSSTYQAAMTATDGFSTRQLFLARLPVLFGGVTV